MFGHQLRKAGIDRRGSEGREAAPGGKADGSLTDVPEREAGIGQGKGKADTGAQDSSGDSATQPCLANPFIDLSLSSAAAKNRDRSPKNPPAPRL